MLQSNGTRNGNGEYDDDMTVGDENDGHLSIGHVQINRIPTGVFSLSVC